VEGGQEDSIPLKDESLLYEASKVERGREVDRRIAFPCFFGGSSKLVGLILKNARTFYRKKGEHQKLFGNIQKSLCKLCEIHKAFLTKYISISSNDIASLPDGDHGV
jgi:hypothetical protein